MKTLTTNQDAARAASGHSITRILKLGTGASAVFYSTRDPDKTFNPDASKTIIPLINNWRLGERSADKGVETLPKIQRFSFSLRITDRYGVPIDQQVDDSVGGFQGTEVIAYQVLRPLTGVVVEADWVVMFRGEIELVTEISNTQVSFECVDFSKYKGQQQSIRIVTRDLFPTAPEKNLGDGMPVVFGQIGQAPGIQVTEGVSSALGAELESTGTQATVDDTSGFTASGKIQIGSEKMTYASKTASLLVGLVRDELQASTHAQGSFVTQLQTTRFLVADQVLNKAIVAGEVKDANGSVYQNFTPVEEETPAGGNIATFIDVEDVDIPQITETLSSNTKLNLAEDLGDDSLTENDWTAGSENDATDPLNAVDSDEATKHVTGVTLVQGETFHVKQIADLSGQTSQIKRVRAAVTYGVIPFRDQAWPAISPLFQIIEGSTIKSSVTKDLGEPTELSGDTKLFPESDADAPTTDLFQTTGAAIGTQRSVDTRFKAIATPVTQTWVTTSPSGTIDNDSWLLLQSFNDGDTINYSSLNVRSTLVTGFTSASFVIGDLSVQVASLQLRIFDDGSWPDETTEILVNFTVKGFNVVDQDFNPIKGSASAIIRIGSYSFSTPGVTVTGLDFNTTKTLSVRLSASDVGASFFTQADLETVELRAGGLNQFVGGGADGPDIADAADVILYRILAVDASIVEGTSLLGQFDPIDSASIVPSQRVTQTTVITSLVNAGGGWDWFGGRPSFLPGISVKFPPQSNGYQIVIYNVEWFVDVLETSTRATLPSEYTLRVDLTGIVTTSPTTLSAFHALSTIFGSSFYNLSPSEIDATSLISALDIVALELASEDKDDWIFQRRLATPTTNRDLLRQALTDAGLRIVVEEGKFKFFPQISADPLTEPSVRTIDSDKMRVPVRTTTSITLVSNQITVQYRESLLSLGQFEAEAVASDQESIDAIKLRELTLQSKFIRSQEVADALASHIVDDFAFSRSLVQISVYGGRAYDLEVGDVVTLTDSFTRLSEQLVRITDISPATASDSEINFVLALSNKSTVIWQHGVAGDADFSKITINTLTQALQFTVDNVLVAKLDGQGLSIKGDMLDGLFAVSVENTVVQADPALRRSNSTGLVEYVAAPGNGLSNGQIAIAVYNGADAKFYRVMTLGFNTAAGPLENASLFVNDYEDEPLRPAILPGFSWDRQIDDTSTGAAVDGSAIMSADLLRLYLSLDAFLDGGAINGRLVVKNVFTNVSM